MQYISLNGKLIPDTEPVIRAANPSFRYGQGLFESARLWKGEIPLLSKHIDRLKSGLELIGSDSTIPPELSSWISELVAKNNLGDKARVRIQAFEEGAETSFLIEATPLSPEAQKLNTVGMHLGIFPFASKSTDAYSNLKSSQYLTYIAASRFAQKEGWDEALVLNSNGAIADATRFNIFIIKNYTLVTPPLSEGCVAGVFRRALLEYSYTEGIALVERKISEKDLLDSEEIFLTNAVSGIRWVQHFGGRNYKNEYISRLYNQLIPAIWP